MQTNEIQVALLALTNRGLTQVQLAAELECSQANIHYHLNSKAKKPRATMQMAAVLKRLCKRHKIELSCAESRKSVDLSL